MGKLKKLITKPWFYVVVFIVTLIVPFIINELYKVGTGYITLWGATDVLAFYGSYLSFVGTVILGVVAVYQNKKAQTLNKQLQKLQQAQFVSMVSISRLEISKRSEKAPKYQNLNMKDLQIISLKMDSFKTAECYHVDVEFENSSQYPIVQLVIHPGSRKNSNCILWGMEAVTDVAIYIPPQGKKAIRFIIPSAMFEAENKYAVMLSVDFFNVFDFGTPATIYLSDLENTTRGNKFEYRLSKFIDVRPQSE